MPEQASLFHSDDENTLRTLTVVGVDEAGRGPLAGAVYAAAVALDPLRPIDGLMDSKKLTEGVRSRLALEIKEKALAWSIAFATVEEIDQLNILQATLLAMRRAVDALELKSIRVLVDGNRLPKWPYLSQAIVKGDQLEPAISAASILAKTARDENLLELDQRYPHYGFAQHKGYGTALHLERLAQYGPCVEHRKSFAPIKKFFD